MIQTCHLKKIKAATRNEQFFVFSSPAVDPLQTADDIFRMTALNPNRDVRALQLKARI